MNPKYPWLAALLMFAAPLALSETDADGLDALILERDARLFQAGFNDCDIETMRTVVADDMEFYHDQSGVMRGKEAFVASIRDGICQLDYRARRELVEESLRVFPLHDGGRLYGAIQEGSHRFYATYPGEPEVLTSTARFSILWQLRDGEWLMTRTLSYDHVAPGPAPQTRSD